MKNLSKKLESLISIFILLFCGFLSGFLIHKHFFSLPDQSQAIKTADKQITLPDINWSEQSKTLILALQTSCHFCNESAPFYKRLIEDVKGKNIKLVAVLPTDVEESKKHLDKLGLTAIDVKQSSLDSIQVNGTPTLILVDDKGEVTNYWVGKLPPNKESEVISKLTS